MEHCVCRCVRKIENKSLENLVMQTHAERSTSWVICIALWKAVLATYSYLLAMHAQSCRTQHELRSVCCSLEGSGYNIEYPACNAHTALQNTTQAG